MVKKGDGLASPSRRTKSKSTVVGRSGAFRKPESIHLEGTKLLEMNTDGVLDYFESCKPMKVPLKSIFYCPVQHVIEESEIKNNKQNHPQFMCV